MFIFMLFGNIALESQIFLFGVYFAMVSIELNYVHVQYF